MAKISALELVENPDGQESVLVLKDGEAKRVDLAPLLDAGAAPILASAAGLRDQAAGYAGDASTSAGAAAASAGAAAAAGAQALVDKGIDTKPGAPEFALTYKGDDSRWFGVTPSQIFHPVIDAFRSAIATLQAFVAGLGSSAQSLTTKVGAAEFSLTYAGDKSRWFSVTPTKILHPVIDTINASLATLQASVSTFIGAAQALGTRTGATEFSLYFGADKTRWFRMTPTVMQHPVVDGLVKDVSGLKTNGAGASFMVRDSKWDSIQIGAEVTHFEGVGQSEMQGYPGGLYTTASLPGALMFSGGVRPDNLSVDPATIYASLVDLQESFLTGSPAMADTTANDTGSVGETPMMGAMKMFLQLIRDNEGTDPASNGQKFLCSVSARGGASVTQLMNGGVRYPRTKANIENGPLAARALGKAYRPGCIFGAQGIGDILTSMTAATWKSNWLALMASMQSDWQAAAGTASPIPMIFYQTSSAAGGRYNGAEPTIPIAQLQLALENDYIANIGPTFFMPYRNSDVHFVPQGTEWMGAYFGWIAYQWLYKGYKAMPFRPIIRIEGNQVVAKYPVLPGRKLVADTSRVELMPNLGMQAFNSAGAEQTLSLPRFSGNDCVVWDATSPLSSWYFGYAWRAQTAANKTQLFGGNLRDDNPLIYEPAGMNVPMQRWAPIDKLTPTV